ncbi:hypothetical protein R3I94_000042 [Phoxinus phoxinus]
MSSGVVLVSAVLLTLLIVWICGHSRRRRPGEPPLVSGWIPIIGVTLDYATKPLGFLREAQRKYGDVFTCAIAGKYFTFVTDPFSFPTVVRQSRNLDFKKFSLGVSRRVFGHANFNDPQFSESYREVHSLFRQTLQGPSLQELGDSMMSNLQTVLDRENESMLCNPQTALGRENGSEHRWLEEGLQSFTNRIMFEAGFLTLFGRDPGFLKASRTCMREFLAFDHAFPFLAAGVPIGLIPRVWRAREALAEELMHEELHQRECISDLIRRRMEAFDHMHLDETGKARTHVCMLWASQANTLPAAFWSLYYTLRSADALTAARTEINSVLSGQVLNNQDQRIELSREQLDSMTVLESIIEEALRLSSASMMIRVANEDFTLTLDSGQTADIRRGDHVALYPQLIHLDPEIYPDPTEFRFDRFLDENGQRKTHFFRNGRRLKHFLIPFGSGVSECPGRFFALHEIKQFLVVTLWRYDLHLCDAGVPPDPDARRAGLGVLPPTWDVPLRYRRRTHT